MNLLTKIVALLFIICTGTAQDECMMKNRRSGTCIFLQDCPELFSIFQDPQPIPQSSITRVREANCGFDGFRAKVCCPTAPTYEASAAFSDSVLSESISNNPPNVVGHPNIRLLNNDICGPVTEPKVIGDTKTGVLEFPWMALIAYQTGSGQEFRCSGSIINKRYILTAAHCLYHLPSDITVIGVRVGEHNLTTERDCDLDETGQEIVCGERYQDFTIESFEIHPNYSLPSLHNDIALIRVKKDLDFRPLNVKPVCLPIGTAATLRSRKVIVAGWGVTESGTHSRQLSKLSLTPVENDNCTRAYGNSAQIWHKQMCAGGEPSRNSCSGDSGGPLFAPAIYYNNARFVQYGIVSYGPKRCGLNGIPSVYTSTVQYLDWILNILRD